MGMVAIKETTLYWGILFPKNLNLKFLRGCNFDVLRNLDPTKNCGHKNMNKRNKIKNLEYTKNMKFKHNLVKKSLNLVWCNLSCTLNT
jgi:hypothetical protein